MAMSAASLASEGSTASPCSWQACVTLGSQQCAASSVPAPKCRLTAWPGQTCFPQAQQAGLPSLEPHSTRKQNLASRSMASICPTAHTCPHHKTKNVEDNNLFKCFKCLFTQRQGLHCVTMTGLELTELCLLLFPKC